MFNLLTTDAEVMRASLIIGIVIGVIVDLILAGITSSIAGNKNRNSGGWWCLSFFLLGWIALIIIICLPPLEPKPEERPVVWICKNCGNPNVNGEECKYCGAKRQ